MFSNGFYEATFHYLFDALAWHRAQELENAEGSSCRGEPLSTALTAKTERSLVYCVCLTTYYVCLPLGAIQNLPTFVHNDDYTLEREKIMLNLQVLSELNCVMEQTADTFTYTVAICRDAVDVHDITSFKTRLKVYSFCSISK
jgi:hypothetical protein